MGQCAMHEEGQRYGQDTVSSICWPAWIRTGQELRTNPSLRFLREIDVDPPAATKLTYDIEVDALYIRFKKQP